MTYEYVTYIAAPVNAVWLQLTTKLKIDKYFLAPVQKIDLQIGGEVIYGTHQHSFVKGRFTEINTNNCLSHSFKFSHLEDPESNVTYVLKNLGPMTALVLLHRDRVADSQTHQDIANAWPGMMSQLKTLLETGRPLPWPQS